MSLTRGLIIKSGRPILPQWRLMPVATFSIVDPVDGTMYEVLPTTGDVLAVYATGFCTQPENVRCTLTIDGVVYTDLVPGVAALTYWYISPTSDTLDNAVVLTPLLVTCQSFRMQIGVVGDAFAGETLSGYLRYGQL